MKKPLDRAREIVTRAADELDELGDEFKTIDEDSRQIVIGIEDAIRQIAERLGESP